MPCRRISFLNFKGGVGKTSISVNVAAFLAYKFNKKVLLIDCDSQSNASTWLMGHEEWLKIMDSPEETICSVFLDNLPPKRKIAVVKKGLKKYSSITKLDLVPANYKLMDFDEGLIGLEDPEPYYLRFYKQIQPAFGLYDYIIFDCPPNMLRASKSAVFTSSEIYVPANPDRLSFYGLRYLVRRLKEWRESTRKDTNKLMGFQFPKVKGIIINNLPNTANREIVINEIKSEINQLKLHNSDVVHPEADVLKPKIRSYNLNAMAVQEEVPVALFAGDENLKTDYENLARYIDKSY